ncbi:type 1 periplasmic-binding domain-containing protein [Streptomyces spongiae]|uniref:ABC transporter substrate-binding protein n=1 Tax=Streptomyces spongiae TaxID=565072 RepID=A0A5N8XET3_9ACTN|nr:ABC transporter substrate-binding protein [Streptomyces spongiae]MPY57458.1 ABC transporter substrate-binding protein [Streptomyces spongiae]
MSTEGGIEVQRQLETLIGDFRTSEPPMPVVVLHAEEAADDTQVAGLVGELRNGQDTHGTRCAVAPAAQEGATEVLRAARLVRDLGDPKRWGGRHSIYRRYAFPRVRLVHAIEDAVRALGTDWPGPPTGSAAAEAGHDPAQDLLNQLAKQRWRPDGSARWHSGLPMFDMAHILPASLVTVLAALLARSDWYMAVASGVGFLLLLAVLNYVLPGRAPIFLWLRRESRWFMTTTFLRAAAQDRPTEVSLLRPVRSWKAIAARAYDVAEALKAGHEFQLQLYVLALFEDLRDNHRRRSWDLRGFKRLRPPMLFVPRIGTDNGGIELIKAVSDVRSRRSELDPLLLVAAVPAADVRLLERSVVQGVRASGTDQGFQARLRGWYDEWARNLRAEQSPSRERAVLPWVLKIPLPQDELRPLPDRQRHCVKAATRPTVARVVWALHTLALVLALTAATAAWRTARLSDEYCSSSVLTANRDTERRPAPDGGTECIGIATDDVRFADWLPDDAKEPDAKALSDGRAVPWTVAELEDGIRTENADVLADHRDNYVTLVYAGPLSADPDGGSSPVKGLEELAGVYLAQSVINNTFTVKLRVLIANGGVDLHHQSDMADAIAAYAAKDPTVVGVVGTGRDLKSSTATTRKLRNAGLPVVSGTNSATYLPREFANWFSLAATDEWQSSQLGLIAKQLRTPGTPQYALVLARDTKKTDDRYTTEQARYGGAMLDKYGFTPLPERHYTLKGGKPEFRLHTEEICRGDRVPSVIYFAGRVEDVDPLMTQLGTEPGCARKKMSVITGDDLSKADFSQGEDAVAPNVTLYHAALAELEEAASGTTFYEDARKYLPGLDKQRVRYDTPAFASGQTALSHDATRALYWAATRGGDPQSRAATWVNLRTVKLQGMATGTIDFTDAPLYGDRKGHSIVLKEVWRTDDGISKSRVVCRRVAGDARPLTEKECVVKRHG